MAGGEWDFVQIGGAVGAAALAFFAAIKGKRESNGTPPDDRAPAPNEVKAAIADLRAEVGRSTSMAAGEFDAINDKIDRIERRVDQVLDRLERDSHMGGILARLAKSKD